MSELAISARDLTKTYKLYASPSQRVADLLGLLRKGREAIAEHRALAGVTFDIARGEKVGIIGRNGAGKSTLLKLVTRVIEPTSGRLDIKGETRALLQIGTGFHPDFTGRQNVEAYLANLGIGPRQAAPLVDEAIAFAELEDYADQPVKTYSTGMGMRLMFAASTMIMPDLLVIDEVLGVGDAYFQNKSFDRISELCSSGDTTLLLVTHDIYSAARLCDRMIWLDRGRMLIDADPATVIRAYEDSIRQQEERRLRAKALSRFGDGAAAKGKTRVMVELRAAGNRPPPSPVHFSTVALTVGGTRLASLPFGDAAFEPKGEAHLQSEGANWGEVALYQGRQSRALLNYGSPFHKVSGIFDLDPALAADGSAYGLIVDYWMDEPAEIDIVLHTEDGEHDLGKLAQTVGQWARHEAKAQAANESERSSRIVGNGSSETSSKQDFVASGVNTTGLYGSGDIRIDRFRVVDESGHESYVVPVRGVLEFQIDYTIARPGLKERAQIVLAFKKDGLHDMFRLFADEILFDQKSKPSGTLVMRATPCPLATGNYSIALLMAAESYYDRPQSTFFSLNKNVYAVISPIAEITVNGSNQLYHATGAVGEARCSLA